MKIFFFKPTTQQDGTVKDQIVVIAEQDAVVSCSVIDNCDPICNDLTTNTCSLTLNPNILNATWDSPEDEKYEQLVNIFIEGLRFSIYDDVNENLYGTFFMKEINRDNEKQWTITGMNRLETLRELDWEPVMYEPDTPFVVALSDICDGYINYGLDATLYDQTTVSGYLGGSNRKEALQLLLASCYAKHDTEDALIQVQQRGRVKIKDGIVTEALDCWFLTRAHSRDATFTEHDVTKFPDAQKQSQYSSFIMYGYSYRLLDPACPYDEPDTTLQNGDTGDGVRWLQWYLWNIGYFSNESDVTGTFGSATETAVRNFQTSRSITVDGIVGSDTRKQLKSAYPNGASGEKARDGEQYSTVNVGDDAYEQRSYKKTRTNPNFSLLLSQPKDYTLSGLGLVPKGDISVLMKLKTDYIFNQYKWSGLVQDIDSESVGFKVFAGDTVCVPQNSIDTNLQGFVKCATMEFGINGAIKTKLDVVGAFPVDMVKITITPVYTNGDGEKIQVGNSFTRKIIKGVEAQIKMPYFENLDYATLDYVLYEANNRYYDTGILVDDVSVEVPYFIALEKVDKQLSIYSVDEAAQNDNILTIM